MRKMTKVLSVLTVLAMLATLFVAVPASATLTDDVTNAPTPAVTVVFTSDDEGLVPVDPNALAVGDTFYAWPEFSNLLEDAYICKIGAALYWDTDVVAVTEADYADALILNEDFEDAVFGTNGKTGSKLQCWGRYDTESYYYENGYDDPDMFRWGFFETVNANKAKSTGEFVQVTGTTIRLYGLGFEKIADGNVGITIAAQNKVINGKDVNYDAAQYDEAASLYYCDDSITVTGNTQKGFSFNPNVPGMMMTDNSPVDGAATEAPTDEPTDAPATDVPVSSNDVTGDKQASQSTLSYNQNAFFYSFETPAIPGEVTGLTATFQIPGKDVKEGNVRNISLTGISDVALKIVAVVKNIPEGQEDTEVTTNYVLSYTDKVTGANKTLEWSRTSSLN